MTPASKLIAEMHRRDFAEEVAKPDRSIRLEFAALLVAAEDEAHLKVDIVEYLLRLAGMGIAARERLDAAPGAAVEVFNHFMFEELGFKGNSLNYYHPYNSYLNHVLDQRTGIPLTLSIIYMEVGRKAGLNVEGINMPGHFIVRASESDSLDSTLVDPFYGKTLTPEECEERVDQIYDGHVALSEEHLRPVTTREILVRLLTNLEASYMRARLYRQALAMVERILLLAPGAVSERRDRGMLLGQLERLPEAVKEIQAYLNLAPQDADLEQVREQLHLLQRQQAMRN